MLVHYYGIPNCRLENWDGETVLIAPSSASAVLLSERGFRETPQGEWIRLFTAEEIERARVHEANRPDEPLIFGETPQDPDAVRKAERLHNITRLLLCLTAVSPLLVLILTEYLNIPFDAALTAAFMLPLLFLIAAFVAAIYNHTRYPFSVKAGTALQKMTGGLVLTLMVVSFTWFACDAACDAEKEAWNKNFTRSCTCCQIK